MVMTIIFSVAWNHKILVNMWGLNKEVWGKEDLYLPIGVKEDFPGIVQIEEKWVLRKWM